MTPAVERATLHCSMGVQPPDPDPGNSPAAGAAAAGVRRSPCDKRLVWMTHPDVREALPRAWQQKAWDVWRAGLELDEDVLRWHERPSTDQPQRDFALAPAAEVVALAQQ